MSKLLAAWAGSGRRRDVAIVGGGVGVVIVGRFVVVVAVVVGVVVVVVVLLVVVVAVACVVGTLGVCRAIGLAEGIGIGLTKSFDRGHIVVKEGFLFYGPGSDRSVLTAVD